MKFHRIIVVTLLLGFFGADAKVKRARSYEKLQKMLATAPYSLVLFLKKSKEIMRDKAAKQKIINLEKMFGSLGKDSYYKDAQLQFISADAARSDLQTAVKKYDIMTMPSFVIFLGRELKSLLPGYAYRDDVEAFVDRNLKVKMQETIKQADELREKKLEEAKIRAYNRSYWYPYGWYGPYWYRPYWYGPYWGYGRPYGGFYFGW